MVQDLCASVVKAASGLAAVLRVDAVPASSAGDKINSTAAGIGSAPAWAVGAKDARDVLHWDSE